MAKIETYAVAAPAGTDLLVGTDANDNSATKNFTVQSIWDGQDNLTIEDEGILILNDVTTLNFIGASVTATSPGASQVDITMAAGLAAGVSFEVQLNLGGALGASPDLTFIPAPTSTLTTPNITSTTLVTINELKDTIVSLRGGILQNHIAPLGQIGQLILNTDLGTHGALLLNGAQITDTPAPVTGGIYASEIHINSINGNTAGGGGSYQPTYAFGARIQNDSLFLSLQNPLTTYLEARLIVGNDQNLVDANLQTNTASILTSNAIGGLATQVISPGNGGQAALKFGHQSLNPNVWSMGIDLWVEGNPNMAEELVFSDSETLQLGPIGSMRMSLTPSHGKTESSILKLWNAQSDQSIGLRAEAVGGVLGVSRTYVLPTAIPFSGNPNKVLECNDASTMEWAEKGSPVLSLVGVPIAYTLVMSDAYRYIRVDTTGTGTIDCPHDATTDFPIGTEISFINVGSGIVAINGAPGTNINFFSPSGSLSCFIPGGLGGGIGRAWTIKKIASNTYDIIGNLG